MGTSQEQCKQYTSRLIKHWKVHSIGKELEERTILERCFPLSDRVTFRTPSIRIVPTVG